MKENKNHLKNDNLPRKWSSKFQEDSDELEDDEDEDEEQDSTTSDIDVDDDSDIDDVDDEESVDLYDKHDNDDDDDFTRRSVVCYIIMTHNAYVSPITIVSHVPYPLLLCFQLPNQPLSPIALLPLSP